jgi:hypothetical protein
LIKGLSFRVIEKLAHQGISTHDLPIEGVPVMVRVVECKDDVGQDECIEFRVYRSSRDRVRILGSWQFGHMEPVGPRGAIAIEQNPLGSPVETEFLRVVHCADQYGVAFVLVIDPGGLFPPCKRPSVYV